VLPDVCGVPDHVDCPVRIACRDEFGQLTGIRDLPGAPGTPEPGQDRQAYRPGAERQVHDDPGDDPAVAEPDRLGTLRRAVVMPGRGVHLLPRAFEQGVVDYDDDRHLCGHQQRHDQIGHRQAGLVGTPACSGEEPVRPGVVPGVFEPCAQQHPADCAPAGLRDQTDHQAAERAVARSGETGAESGQQNGQRGYVRCWSIGGSLSYEGESYTADAPSVVGAVPGEAI
jgi:hypothetical protein